MVAPVVAAIATVLAGEAIRGIAKTANSSAGTIDSKQGSAGVVADTIADAIEKKVKPPKAQGADDIVQSVEENMRNVTPTGNDRILLEDFSEVSDTHLKDIHEAVKKGKVTADILKRMFKEFPGYDTYHVDDADYWRDDVLDGYIKYIKNYHYNYKPEATEIDPTIDPNEEHIGVMAQDVEKVNPATVMKDDSGFLKVDTGRLALMNSGAIAELARRVEKLKEKIDG